MKDCMEDKMLGDVVYVDEAEGLNRILQNKKLYVKLLDKFKALFNSKLDELILNLKEGKNEEAQAIAHALKGAAANLSLTELYKQSLNVESQIKSNVVNSESLQNIKVCFDNTLNAIDVVIKKYGGL